MIWVNPRPAGVVKLAGPDDLWRIRVGNSRMVDLESGG